MRFKIIHLLFALTITALVAILVRQFMEAEARDRHQLLATSIVLLIVGLVTGVAIGFAGGGGAMKQMSRWQLAPLATAVGLFFLLALFLQRSSLAFLQHADHDVAPIILFFAELNNLHVFDLLAGITVLVLAWGVVVGKPAIVRYTAAAAGALWIAIFAFGYCGAAMTSVY
jgi:hypothetical protein